MKRQLINVTKENIAIGQSVSSSNCPVALAINSQTSSTSRVGVRVIDTFTINGYYYKSYKVPTRVRAFINRFDRNKPVKPFNFYLEKA